MHDAEEIATKTNKYNEYNARYGWQQEWTNKHNEQTKKKKTRSRTE